MKNKTTSLLVSLLLTLWAPLLFAKGAPQPHGADKSGTFPGKGESTEQSNAPSTGTQMKGKERAMEVGHGKKKGLYKKHKGEEVPATPATPAPESAPQTLPR